MLRRLTTIGFLAFLALTAAARAQEGARGIDRLYELLRIAESVAILHDEGLTYALNSEEVVLGRTVGEGWAAAMTEIYDLDAQQALVRTKFEQALQGIDPAPLVEAFSAEAAQKAIRLELSARHAFLAPGVEQAAREHWRADPGGGAHAEAIARFIEVNDLIGHNVANALNSNFLFLRALSEGNGAATEAQILADVWAGEEDIRTDTEEWLYAFLTLAYAPLSEAEMQAYLSIWVTAEGQSVNAALYAGFDPMFEAASEAIGRAAARFQEEPEL